MSDRLALVCVSCGHGLVLPPGTAPHVATIVAEMGTLALAGVTNGCKIVVIRLKDVDETENVDVHSRARNN